MLPRDPTGKSGPKRPLPDSVRIFEPKEEDLPLQPYSEQKGVPKATDTPLEGAAAATPSPAL